MRYLFIALLMLIAGCSPRSAGDGSKERPSFKAVKVPSSLNDPIARANYRAEHFWDNFDFTDTTYISMPEITEQAFSDYLGLLGSGIKADKVRRSINNMMSGAEQDSTMFAYFCDLAERYLYHPNSPMRNEELYIPVLEYILASAKVDDLMKIRPAQLLEMAMKNRPGFKANDFTYTTIQGARSNLYRLKSDYTLLFFNNPDCTACKEITEQIIASQVIGDLIADKRISILAIYPDEELDQWRAYAPNIPKNWINACDRECKLRNLELYDLKAIPTLYLLDKDKKVLLKDVNFVDVEQMLAYYMESQPDASPAKQTP